MVIAFIHTVHRHAFVWILTFATLATLFAFAPSTLAEEAPLRWGADTESGAPFAFKDPRDPEKLIGFEVDIINEIGRRLNRRTEFVQNQWDGLIQGLKRKDYDVVINGLEVTPDRREVVRFSRPYMITGEVLTVRKDENLITALKDLPGKRVGTLDGSLALRILKSDAPEAEAVIYDEEVHAYNDLDMKRIDAVFLDEPIAIYYAKPKTGLKTISTLVGRIEYGIALRPEDEELAARIDQALTEMIRDGTLRSILENWALWNDATASEWGLDPKPASPPSRYQDFLIQAGLKRTWLDKAKQYAGFLPLLAKGAGLTLLISIVSMALAIVVGLIVALSRQYGPRCASFLALSFVEIFRGTPLLIQLYLIFYGLPKVGIELDPFTAAVLGLGLNYGACEAENYRAGILSVPKAQMDAAQALGMSRRQGLRFIVVPQAFRMVLPPITNDFIALLKDSSLVSVITMVELTTIYGQLASTYFDYLGIGVLVAVVYFLIGLPFVRLARYAETRIGKARN